MLAVKGKLKVPVYGRTPTQHPTCQWQWYTGGAEVGAQVVYTILSLPKLCSLSLPLHLLCLVEEEVRHKVEPVQNPLSGGFPYC
jgi:hypothetical protein